MGVPDYVIGVRIGRNFKALAIEISQKMAFWPTSCHFETSVFNLPQPGVLIRILAPKSFLLHFKFRKSIHALQNYSILKLTEIREIGVENTQKLRFIVIFDRTANKKATLCRKSVF